MLSRFMKFTIARLIASLITMSVGFAPFNGGFVAEALAKEKMKVATTFTVLADMAKNVAGDAADVVSITKPGANIHLYQPTPGDIVRVSDADLVLRNGLNLELWFEQFLSNLGDMPSFTLSDGIEPILISSGEYEGKPNPHAWMGLQNGSIYIDNIVAAFAKRDPENAAIYEKNGAEYKARLQEAILPLKQEIDKIAEGKRWLVSCEGAFSYLARDLGLKEMYLWPINAEQTGTPKQIRKVIDAVREHSIPAVFCESTVSNKPAQQVARETNARFGGVLYVDSLSKDGGPIPTYLDLLKVTTATIANALGQTN